MEREKILGEPLARILNREKGTRRKTNIRKQIEKKKKATTKI